jgi:hypothetical protein
LTNRLWQRWRFFYDFIFEAIMPITSDNIKILAAERNTDNPDGGGRLTGNVLQSGVDNNLFDDVDPLSRVTSGVQLRKFGAAVVAAGTDKYMGARLMIAKPPVDTKVHALLFSPQYPDDTRVDAVKKMSSFLAPGGTYHGLLYGNHLAGMNAVIFLQRLEATPPVVGDVLYLIKDEGLITEVNQFVQVTTVSVVERTFTYEGGEFSRNQVTCGISTALAADYAGFEAVRLDVSIDYTGKTKMRETVVADAAQYFGTSKLAVAGVLGDLSVKAASIFEQLLPSSQVETVLLNRDPTPPANLRINTGTAIAFTPPPTWTDSTNLQLPGACYPSSFSVTTSAGAVTDVAGKLRLAGADVGAIDYDAGIATLLTGVSLTTTAGSYKPAGTAVRAPQASGLEVTVNNRAQNYAVFLDPVPMAGSVSVSYMAGGRWYVLADDAGGGLRGSSAEVGAGQVNYEGGFISVSLGVLPDIGSHVMIAWGGATQETKWPSAVLKAQQTITIAGALALTPGSITITWPNPAGGGNLTATDSNGVLAGSATGKVSYARREIVFAPNMMPAIGAQLTIAYSDAPKQTDTFAHPARNGGGQVPVTAALGAVTPNSLEVEWDTLTDVSVLGAYTATQLWQMNIAPVDPTHIARDNGAGNVVLNGVNIGTVVYATGVVTFNPDVTVAIPRPNYTVGQQVMPGKWRINFSGITYVNAPSLYPNDTSGRVVLRYISAAGGTSQNSMVTFAPSLDMIPDVKPAVLPNSVLLSVGAGVDLQYMADNGLGVLRTYISGAWVTRGTVSYTNATGALTTWPSNAANAFTRHSLVSVAGEILSSEFVFRTAAAPLKPSSLSIQYSRPTGGVQTVNAAPDGTIVATGVAGLVDWQTGIVRLNFGAMVTAAGNEAEPWYNAAAVVGGLIWKPNAIAVSTLRYTAVAYTYLSLSEDVLGVDPVRLPQDGRVAIFKRSRVVVVHHTKDETPQTVTNSTTINTGRLLLSWLKVYGADGIEILNGFSKNLNAGTVSFSNVTGYSQPVTVQSRIETEALCSDALIDGTVQLLRPLAHNYPANESFVSSVLLGGTLQAGATQSFSQQAWTDEWLDTRIGNPILAQYDQTTYPIAVSNDGAITQRWTLIFTSNTTFRLVGETRGEVITGSTATVLSPVNPVTGIAMFTLQPAGWGGGWSAGNVLRFNTKGALLPAWCARTVEQSQPAAAGTDQILIEVRGAIDA